MLDSQKLTELYKSLVKLLTVVWRWLEKARQALLKPQAAGDKPDDARKPSRYWWYVYSS